MIEQPSSQKYMNGVPYAAQSQYKELPNEDQSITGVIPLDTCPAGWWNGLWNFVTEQEIKITDDMDVIIKEIVAVIERAGIIDVTAQNTLSKAIVTLAQTIATSNIPGAVISSSDDGSVAVDNTGKMTLNGYNDLVSGLGDIADLDTTTKSSVVSAINEIIGLKGQPNGFASLDADGRIPFSQLPESAVEYKGEWNASTNVPPLVDGTGTTGDMYYVSTEGTQDLGSGDIVFLAGDRIIYNGTIWQKLSGGSVKSVNNIKPDDTGNVNIEIEDSVKSVNNISPDSTGNIQLTGENIQVSTTDDTLLSKFKLRDIFSHLLGRYWTQSNITSGTFYVVTYANGIWVAGSSSVNGKGNGLYYSQDGITWTQSNITSGSFYVVTYANGIWVAGSYSNRGLYYSQDGKTWTQSNITSGTFYVATYANGIWVAGSSNNRGLYYSQDGKTWTQSNITSDSFYVATYANDIWVAGSKSNGLYYSQDGITWTQSNITSDSFYDVTYANGIWVAGSYSSKGLYYSQDGITWTQSNITSGSFYVATYANGIWVAGSSSGNSLYYSQDGKTWTQSNITSGYFRFVTYANGIWVAGSYSNSGLYYSQDGITWTQSNITSGTFYDVTYANGIWVAGSYSNSSGKGLYYSDINTLIKNGWLILSE